jgi:predicted amidohydrolase
VSDAVVACCQVALAVGDLDGNRAAVDRMVRQAAGRGADVVVVPELAASGYVFRDAACDRTGRERGVEWVGGSVIVDPDGWPMAGPLSAGDAEPILAVCRLQEAGDKALGPRNDVHGDRRPELYDSVRAAGRV